MPLGVKHWTEPMTAAERAANKAEQEQWRAMERRIAELEASLRGIVNHWNEFGEMMFANKDDYGLSERLDAAAKLVE